MATTVSVKDLAIIHPVKTLGEMLDEMTWGATSTSSSFENINYDKYELPRVVSKLKCPVFLASEMSGFGFTKLKYLKASIFC
jgi:hypothetical protein